MNRQERRKREVHQRIIDAAIELFDREGVAATRIDDICEHADLAQKTFFNHFPTKEHLFREIAGVFVRNVGEIVEEARKQPGNTADKLLFLFRRAGEIARERGPMHRELVHEVARVAAMANVDALGLQAAFYELLRDGVDAGDVTSRHELAYLTEVILSAFVGVVMSWTLREDYDLDAHLQATARIVARAIQD